MATILFASLSNIFKSCQIESFNFSPLSCNSSVDLNIFSTTQHLIANKTKIMVIQTEHLFEGYAMTLYTTIINN